MEGQRFSRDRYDVIVVGSGGAGLAAATAAAARRASVAVVTKGTMRYSGATASANFSYCAQFGYFGAADTAEEYASDIRRSGLGLADPALAGRLAREAGPAADDLERKGVAWQRAADGTHALATFGGHSHPRAIHVGLRTGKVMELALARDALKSGVDIVEFAFAVEVLLHGGRVAGLLVYDIATGELRSLNAPAVVIATGGPIAMFGLHTNPDELTGDGLALAYDAGAELVDLEFIQHYPTVLLAPAAARGIHLPTGRLFAHGAKLVNSSGEEFFGRHDAVPLHRATRDQVARAIALEIEAGRGTALGGVRVDARSVSAEMVRDVHFEAYFAEIGIDLAHDVQEVSTAAHFALGGIKIDSDGRTSVPGLYAAGEVAGGLHGANRLTGTALPEIVVFGTAAGAAAAGGALGAAETRCETRLAPWIEGLREPGDGPLAGESMARLRALLDTHAGVLKTAQGLEAALEEIARIEQHILPLIQVRTARRSYNWEMVRCLELRAMLASAHLHCLASLAREESRGAHQRLDHPRLDEENWSARLVVERGESGPRLRREAVAWA